MDYIQLPDEGPFIVGTTNLRRLLHHYVKISDFALFICTKGNGRIMIDMEEYELQKDTIVLFMPGSVISCIRHSDDLEVFSFVCDREIFLETGYRLEHAFFAYLKTHPCLTLAAGHSQRANELFSVLYEIYLDKEHIFRKQIIKNMLQCCLMNMYDNVFRYTKESETQQTEKKTSLLHRFVRLVHEHFREEREVNFYANKLCITRRYLSKVVNETSGHTPKEVIDRFTVIEIKALLESTELSMKEIADQLHFADQSLFGRFFKRQTGMMPSAYREKSRRPT